MKAWVLSLLFAFASGNVLADDAQTWLTKIDRAARALNFEGVFVYRHDDKMETMRIVHGVNQGKVQERLVSLTGAPREIIRSDGEVTCYLPDENSVVVEHRRGPLQRRTPGKAFPSILPQQISDLAKNYDFQLGRAGRVADRDAQLISIKPKDGYRYGYELWADKATALLLRADLLDDHNRTVEQFVFTSITPDAKITATDLSPRLGKKTMVWHRSNGDNDTADQSKDWVVERLPPGFTLSTRVMRKNPVLAKATEQLVYSDGLATVSVFIEKLSADKDKSHEPKRNGVNHMGAVHAFMKVIDDHQITVVGEVPAASVDLIGQSVKSSSKK